MDENSNNRPTDCRTYPGRRVCIEGPDGLCECGREMKAALELINNQHIAQRTGYCRYHGKWSNADACPVCGTTI